jgi:hypothetical protein
VHLGGKRRKSLFCKGPFSKENFAGGIAKLAYIAGDNNYLTLKSLYKLCEN